MTENRFRLADLTRHEFAEAMKDGRWLLLPFGSIEQHRSWIAVPGWLLCNIEVKWTRGFGPGA